MLFSKASKRFLRAIVRMCQTLSLATGLLSKQRAVIMIVALIIMIILVSMICITINYYRCVYVCVCIYIYICIHTHVCVCICVCGHVSSHPARRCQPLPGIGEGPRRMPRCRRARRPCLLLSSLSLVLVCLLFVLLLYVYHY